MHRALITSLCKIPPGVGNFYVSTSKDGSLVVWNVADLSHEKTLREGGCWTTATAFLPLTKKLCIADFTRAVKIYDSPSFHFVGSIRDLPYAPLCLTAWKSSKKRDVDFICVGDLAGNVLLFEVKCVVSDKKNTDRFNHKLRWTQKLHKDMVTSLKYVEELNSIVSTSTDSTLTITDIELRIPSKRLVGHSKSVNGCDWSSFYKFVCSGGQDRAVILWNPFSLKPLASLIGHAAPVTAVAVHDRGNQILSLSTDKCIKVWDIRNHGCLQTLSDKEAYHPHNTLSAMLFDADLQRLVCGNRKIKGWDMDHSTSSTDRFHVGRIVGLLHNATFEEMISGDEQGNLCIWNLNTGTLRSRFSLPSGDRVLTAIAFDNNERRLLTTTDNGLCHMWNFSNGSLLKSFITDSGLEICDVVCLKLNGRTRVITAGWDKKLSLFEDDLVKKQIRSTTSLSGHQADIVSLAVADGGSIMVSGDYQGVILVWNTESWALKKTYKPSSPTPIVAMKFLHRKWKHFFGVLSGDRMIRVWNVFDGCPTAEAHVTGTPTAMAVHPSNNSIATGTDAGSIHVFDVDIPQSGEGSLIKKAEWFAAKNEVSCLSWIAGEEESLLVAAQDANITIWTAAGILRKSLDSVTADSPLESRFIQDDGRVIRQECQQEDAEGSEEDSATDDSSISFSDSDNDIPSSLLQRSWTRTHV